LRASRTTREKEWVRICIGKPNIHRINFLVVRGGKRKEKREAREP
jgi:hypothetical protein